MNMKLSKSEKIDLIYELSDLLPKDVLVSILLDFNENIDDLINILTGQVLFLKWMDKVSPTPEGFELNLVSFKGVYSYKSDLRPKWWLCHYLDWEKMNILFNSIHWLMIYYLKIWYFEKNYLYLYS